MQKAGCVLLCFQPSPSFKRIFYTDPGFDSDFVGMFFITIVRSFNFSKVRHKPVLVAAAQL